MISPELLFLTPHYVERVARAAEASTAERAEARHEGRRAFVSALRIVRIPLLVALLIVLVAWGTPGAAIAIAVAAVAVASGVVLYVREALSPTTANG